MALRIQLAADYLDIIAYLHASPVGSLIMCDGDHAEKLLSQFLISSRLRMLVSDLDALPLVDRANALVAKCGHRQFTDPQMRAPEQDWPFAPEPFRSRELE